MDGITNIADRKAELSELLAFYGVLLTENQYSMTRLFADEDWSFSEIGEQYRVSRQSAYDTITKAERILNEFEARLHRISAARQRNALLTGCLERLSACEAADPSPAIQEVITVLQSILDKEDC